MKEGKNIVSKKSEIYDDELELILTPTAEGYQAILDGLVLHSTNEDTIRIARNYIVQLSTDNKVSTSELNEFIQESMAELV